MEVLLPVPEAEALPLNEEVTQPLILTVLERDIELLPEKLPETLPDREEEGDTVLE